MDSDSEVLGYEPDEVYSPEEKKIDDSEEYEERAEKQRDERRSRNFKGYLSDRVTVILSDRIIRGNPQV